MTKGNARSLDTSSHDGFRNQDAITYIVFWYLRLLHLCSWSFEVGPFRQGLVHAAIFVRVRGDIGFGVGVTVL